MNFKIYKQTEEYSCGIACLQMVAKHFGVHWEANEVRKLLKYTLLGISLHELQKAAVRMGFVTQCISVSKSNSLLKIPYPSILLYNNHYMVVYKNNEKNILVADPKVGKRKLKISYFNLHEKIVISLL